MAASNLVPRRLPEREGEAWQGGWFEVSIWIRDEEGLPKRPWMNALDAAIRHNVLAAARLLGEDVPPVTEPEVEEDAQLCVRELGDAWLATPGALEWLEDHIGALVRH